MFDLDSSVILSPLSDTHSSVSVERPRVQVPIRRAVLFNRLRLGQPSKDCNYQEPIVKTKNKANPEFGALSPVQNLNYHDPGQDWGSPGGIWTAEFSPDGMYLAAGGESRTLYVWRQKLPGSQEFLLFDSRPLFRLVGHESDILDLSWSKTHQLLSCSLDRTIRLWNIETGDCLHVFYHNECVTSVAFHPIHDHYFASGSIDGQLKMWNIDQSQCIMSKYVPDTLITCINFTKLGQTIMVGSYKGKCFFFEADKLRYTTQTPIKMKTKLCKITNIESMCMDDGFLVSSNDSKIRLFNMRDKIRSKTFRGFSNRSSLTRARCSEDGEYIITGSEDHKVYIWKNDREGTRPRQGLLQKMAKKLGKACCNSFECFSVHNTNVTIAMFGPHSLKEKVLKSLGRESHGPSDGLVVLTGDSNGTLRLWVNSRWGPALVSKHLV